jgi:Ca2+-binding RTX toxin-like protein
LIRANEGNDTLAGSVNDDILYGEVGNDLLRGDVIAGQPNTNTAGGDDVCFIQKHKVCVYLCNSASSLLDGSPIDGQSEGEMH